MIKTWDLISDKEVLNAAFVSKTDTDQQSMIASLNIGGALTVTSNITTSGTVTWSGGSSTNANAAYSHISSDGSSHTFINQDVRTTASPTFATMLLSSANATPLHINRTDSANNATICLQTTAGSIYIGNAGGVDFGVGTNANIYGTGTFKITVSNGNVVSSGTITGTQLISNAATGTAPLSVASTTVVTNLNADSVDGYHFDQGLKTTDTPRFGHLILNGRQTNAAYTKASIFGTDDTVISRLHFTAATNSNDSGVIYHETSDATNSINKGVLHICPSDDNDNTNDYVTIHGSNDPESIKLYTGGNISTTGIITWYDGNSLNANAAYAHISNNGSDHSFINQSVTTTASPTFAGLTLNGDTSFTSANGRGIKFWASNLYKIYMSDSTDATYGGRLDTTSDYNMYFKMSSGTNRGFVFRSDSACLAQIDGGGNIYTIGTNLILNCDNSNADPYLYFKSRNAGNTANWDPYIRADKANARLMISDNIYVSGTIAGTQFISDVATGTAPLSVVSKTLVTNLNSDLLDGRHAASFAYSEVGGTDLNQITYSGMYRISSGLVNSPTGVDYGQLLVIHGGSDTITQIVTDYASDKIYWRSGNPSQVGGTGSWKAWRLIWHDGNDGSGSGLDADTTDGYHLDQDVRKTATPEFYGVKITHPSGPYTAHFIRAYGSNTNGIGIAMDSGGSLIVGSGESATNVSANLPYSSESLWLTSDYDVKIMSAVQNGYAARKEWSFLSDGTMTTPGAINIGGGFSLEYDSTTKCLNFNFIG